MTSDVVWQRCPYHPTYLWVNECPYCQRPTVNPSAITQQPAPTHNHPLYMYASDCPACIHNIAYEPAPKQKLHVYKERPKGWWVVRYPSGVVDRCSTWRLAIELVKSYLMMTVPEYAVGEISMRDPLTTSL